MKGGILELRGEENDAGFQTGVAVVRRGVERQGECPGGGEV